MSADDVMSVTSAPMVKHNYSLLLSMNWEELLVLKVILPLEVHMWVLMMSSMIFNDEKQQYYGKSDTMLR